MTLGLKDIIYILVYVVSIAGAFFALRNELNNIRKENKRIRNIIFADQGKLNLVDQATCKQHQDQIYAAIRRSENAFAVTAKEIKTLNENVVRIMVILDINKKTTA